MIESLPKLRRSASELVADLSEIVATLLDRFDEVPGKDHWTAKMLRQELQHMQRVLRETRQTPSQKGRLPGQILSGYCRGAEDDLDDTFIRPRWFGELMSEISQLSNWLARSH